MTKKELIAALLALPCPDDTEIKIRMYPEQGVPDENCFVYEISDIKDDAIWSESRYY